MVQYRYDAWGNVITEVMDEAHALIAELNPFGYRSYYYDRETHLYYLNTATTIRKSADSFLKTT